MTDLKINEALFKRLKSRIKYKGNHYAFYYNAEDETGYLVTIGDDTSQFNFVKGYDCRRLRENFNNMEARCKSPWRSPTAPTFAEVFDVACKALYEQHRANQLGR